LNGHIAATLLRNVNRFAACPPLVDAAQVEPHIAD